MQADRGREGETDRDRDTETEPVRDRQIKLLHQAARTPSSLRYYDPTPHRRRSRNAPRSPKLTQHGRAQTNTPGVGGRTGSGPRATTADGAVGMVGVARGRGMCGVWGFGIEPPPPPSTHTPLPWQAIELEPGNASSYNSRGLVQDKLGRLDEALADFTQVGPRHRGGG